MTQFVLGNDTVNTTTKAWLTGDITSSGNLYVNGIQVVLMSSRTLKTDITLFEDYDKVLG